MTVYWHENLIRAQESLQTSVSSSSHEIKNYLLLESIAYSLLSLAEDSKAMVTSGVDVPEQDA
jgi:hypothetical protein